MLTTNKAYVYLLFAAFFRFAGGYSIGFWSKKYFATNYPEMHDQFAVGYFLILIFGSVPSELIGGYLTDRYER